LTWLGLFFRRKLQEEKEAELKSQADKLNAKAKRELDALRQRFRIMQTAGALERSPSASESELSMEVFNYFSNLDVLDLVLQHVGFAIPGSIPCTQILDFFRCDSNESATNNQAKIFPTTLFYALSKFLLIFFPLIPFKGSHCPVS
jgi:hypothetical protein